MRVLKYKLEGSPDVNQILIPKNSQILYGGYQESTNSFNIWVLVDTNEKDTELRNILIWNTGSECPYKIKKYISTTMVKEFVFHIFEIIHDKRISVN